MHHPTTTNTNTNTNMHHPTTHNTTMQQPTGNSTNMQQSTPQNANTNMQQPTTANTNTNTHHLTGHHHHHQQSTGSMLNGRVFTRLQEFAALPRDLQNQVVRLEDYLSSIQRELFDTHHTLTLKSIYGARAGHLLQNIEAWINKTQGTSGASAHPRTHGQTAAMTGGAAQRHDHHTGHHQHSTTAQVPGTHQTGGASTTTKTSVVPGAEHVGGYHSPHAKKLLDALVLKGFLTPKKEHKPDEKPGVAINDLDFKDTDWLVAVGKTITLPTSSMSATPKSTVWDLVDGALFAGMVKRKANIIEKLAHGKDVYVMVNSRFQNVTVFAKDVSRKPLLQFAGGSLKVALDSSHFHHGIKLWNENVTEILSPSSVHERDALMRALTAVGRVQDTHHMHGHGMQGATGVNDPRHPVESMKNKMAPTHDHTTGQPMMGHGHHDNMHTTHTHDHDMRQGMGQGMSSMGTHDQTMGQPMNANQYGQTDQGMNQYNQTQPTRDHVMNQHMDPVAYGQASHGMHAHQHTSMQPTHDHTMGQHMNRRSGQYDQGSYGMGCAQCDQMQPTRDHGMDQQMNPGQYDQASHGMQGMTQPTRDHGMGHGMHRGQYDQGSHGMNATQYNQPHDHTIGQQMNPSEYGQTGQGMGDGQYNKMQQTRDHTMHPTTEPTHAQHTMYQGQGPENEKLRQGTQGTQGYVTPATQGNYMP